jgi:hypothetical protein
MGVHAWADGTGSAAAALKLVTKKAGSSDTKTTIKGAVAQLSGCNVVFQIDAAETNKLKEGSHYEFTLSGVPTTESKAGADMMSLGSMVLSVGKMATGGFGYSSAQLFNQLKTGTVKTGQALLEFETGMVTVARGTYTPDAVCIKPASTATFAADVAVSVNGAAFKINPASLSAKMGKGKSCAAMGTQTTTTESIHNVRWTVNNGTAKYTNLPTLKVKVTSKTDNLITVPEKVICSQGGSSVPIVVSATTLPFSDVKVSLEKSVTKEEGKADVDNSAGITINAGEVVTLSVTSTSGILGFTCAKDAKGKQLKYKLDGTDKAVFKLEYTLMTVDAQKATDKKTTFDLKLAMDAAGSEAAKTKVTGTCPGMGASYIQLVPAANGLTIMANAKDVKAAHTAAKGCTADCHKKTQIFYQAITKTGGVTTATFKTMSKGKYLAAMYCETMESHFYATPKTLNITAKDNGGKPVGVTLTYSKPIDDVT